MARLSERIEECDRESQALIADLLPLVREEAVARDPEFQRLLQAALARAEEKVREARNGLDETKKRK